MLSTLRSNGDIVVGAALGYYLSSMAINFVTAQSARVIKSTSAQRWLGVGSAVIVAGAAAWAGDRFGKPRAGAAFAGVALGQAVKAAVQIYTTAAS